MSASDTLIEDNIPRDQYTASSNQTNFSYNFVIFDKEDLTVIKTEDPNSDNPTRTTLTEGKNSDYTISGVGNEDGGFITLTSGATSGDLYTLRRATVIERLTDFLQTGEFRGEDINLELDTVFSILQELQNEIDRAATLKDDDTVDTIELDYSSAHTVIGWDQNGNNIREYAVKDLDIPQLIDGEELLFGSDGDYEFYYDPGQDRMVIKDGTNDVIIAEMDKQQNMKFAQGHIEAPKFVFNDGSEIHSDAFNGIGEVVQYKGNDLDSDGDGKVDQAVDADNVTSTYKGNDLDSNGDGKVDAADDADNVSGTYKGNDLDSNGDGIVDEADSANLYKNNDIDSNGDGKVDSAVDADNVTSTYKGNDLDSNGDGVVDDADNVTSTYKGNDLDSNGDGTVDAADDAANVTGTYKGNDIDSDGDGVVNNSNQWGGYNIDLNGSDSQGVINFKT